MKIGPLALGFSLLLLGHAVAQDATTNAPASATTTVSQEGCAGSVAEACQAAQSQAPAQGVSQHLGFDSAPTAPPPAGSANLPNFTPPPTPQPAARPSIPQQPPAEIPATIVLPAPANAPDGSAPVAIQTQPDASPSGP